MAIALVLYTAGCTNASLYASGNLTDQLPKAQLFPESFGETWRLGLLAIEFDAIVRQNAARGSHPNATHRRRQQAERSVAISHSPG
jgi:hypothetical protein